MAKLIQRNCHIIFCLRADQKLKVVKLPNGKTEYIDAGFQPICEKHFMYEMTISVLMSADKPGTFKPIKMPEELAPIFPPDELLSEKHGEQLAEWARGGKAEPKTKQTMRPDAVKVAQDVAELGTERLRQHWEALPSDVRKALQPHKDALKQRATEVDAAIIEKDAASGEAELPDTLRRRP